MNRRKRKLDPHVQHVPFQGGPVRMIADLPDLSPLSYRNVYVRRMGKKGSGGRYEVLCSYGEVNRRKHQMGRLTRKTFESLTDAEKFLKKTGKEMQQWYIQKQREKAKAKEVSHD